MVKVALAGNRTRAARVAGEHSTTEPPMPLICFCELSSAVSTTSLNILESHSPYSRIRHIKNCYDAALAHIALDMELLVLFVSN